MLTVIV